MVIKIIDKCCSDKLRVVCPNLSICFRRGIYPKDDKCYLKWSQQEEFL